MFKRVVLHIGRHKSGTSSIQTSLAFNTKKLSNSGFLYPISFRGRHVAHHKLAALLNPKKTEKPDIEVAYNLIMQEKCDHHHTLIFSSEAFQKISDLSFLGIFRVEFLTG